MACLRYALGEHKSHALSLTYSLTLCAVSYVEEIVCVRVCVYTCCVFVCGVCMDAEVLALVCGGMGHTHWFGWQHIRLASMSARYVSYARACACVCVCVCVSVSVCAPSQLLLTRMSHLASLHPTHIPPPHTTHVTTSSSASSSSSSSSSTSNTTCDCYLCNRLVVELGAGLGLASLAAASRGARVCVHTRV